MVFAVNKNLAAIKLKVDLLHLQSSNAKKSVRRQPRKTVFLGCGGVWWRIVRGKGGAVYFLKASVDGGILSVRRLARTGVLGAAVLVAGKVAVWARRKAAADFTLCAY